VQLGDAIRRDGPKAYNLDADAAAQVADDFVHAVHQALKRLDFDANKVELQ
jgi:hypothetical protein